MSWKGFKKAVDRLPHNIKSKTGFSKSAVPEDETFELYESRLRGMEEDFDNFLGHVKHYRTSSMAYLNHQKMISELLSNLYQEIGSNDKANVDPGLATAIETYTNSSEAAYTQIEDLLYELDRRIVNPTTEIVSILRSVRKLVVKRSHKLVDLNRHTEGLNKLVNKQNRDVSDEKKLYKLEQLAQVADQEYTQINDILISDLPKLFDMRDAFFPPVFCSLLQIQQQIQTVYFEEMVKLQKVSSFDWSRSPIESFEAAHYQYAHLFEKIDWFSGTMSRKSSTSSSFMDRLKAKSAENNTRAESDSTYGQNHRDRFGSVSETSSGLSVPRSSFHQRSVSNPGESTYEKPPPSYTSTPVSPVLRKAPPPPPPKLPRVRALYDYDAQAEGDLSFKQNDIIDVIKKPPGEDWWTGRLKGKIGVFPDNDFDIKFYMGHLATLATCSLNQWSLDFEGNLARIRSSILLAKSKGAKLRIGPELEITGYGCQDHFLEGDTYLHAWESLSELLKDEELYGILIDVGMPVRHRNVNYNCRVLILDGKILLIRPKQWLANDGNYREMRWFSPWCKPQTLEDHLLPRFIRDITGQKSIPFGDGVISTLDTCIGIDMCEELFTPNSPHIHMSLDGVEIFANGSGSHHELRKLHTRIELVKEATTKCGGVYLYANQQGCDGDRLYYDGCAMIALNGDLLAQGSQFSLNDVEVIIATVDLEEIRTYRGAFRARSLQATRTPSYPRIEVDFALSSNVPIPGVVKTKAQQPHYHTASEEISLGPACWLWDYLRRSNQLGYFLPLSGGLDSCSTAMIVASMCRLVVKACKEGNNQVIKDVRRISRYEADSDYIPSDSKELCNNIFHTAYIGTENSGTATRLRASTLAEEIGSYHLDFDMDNVIMAILTLFTIVTGNTPKYAKRGGTNAENLALQNIQARMRMVLSYLFAQLLPWCRGKSGGLLVLGSANVDECLRGYFTKYDCSSADLNPIGAISKCDLRKFLTYAKETFGIECLQSFLDAQPSAELIPTESGESDNAEEQLDEVEMGMTYDELSTFGQLRQVSRLGPYSMMQRLISEWGSRLSVAEIAAKVKRFFFYYSINRHKMTTLTPAYHAEAYSPDDHRFDLRPFLYNAKFERQFSSIDKLVAKYENTKSDQ